MKFIPYLLLIVTAYSVFAVTVDDPYITFRYAANLITGHGPVFNAGERVEGYTSILQLLVSSVLLTLSPSTDILFKAKVLSLIFGLGVITMTGTLAARSGLSRNGALLAQILVALNIGFAMACVNGLETTLYAFLLLLSVQLFCDECRTGTGYFSGLILFLALLARPEAIIMFVLLFCFRFLWSRRAGLASRDPIRWSAAFLLPSFCLVFWRREYYHAWLPNTYYAKQTSLADSVEPGIKYLLQALVPEAPSFLHHRITLLGIDGLVTAILFWALAGAGAMRLRRSLTGTLLAVVASGAILFVIRAGGDWMPGWRFMVPVIPLIAIFQCHGLLALKTWSERLRLSCNPRWLTTCSGGAVAALWMLSFFLAPHRSWAEAHFSTHGEELLCANNGSGRFWVTVGNYIHNAVPTGAYVAYSELGYAGYANLDKKFLDMRGLTDTEVAHLPSSDKSCTGVNDLNWTRPEDPLYRLLKQRQPDFIFSRDGGGKNTVLNEYKFITVVTTGEPETPAACVYRKPTPVPHA